MIQEFFASTVLSYGDIALRLIAAAICTGLIGWEREHERKPAGLRTHMLVGVGAAAFYIIAIEIILQTQTGTGDVKIDPTRIVQGIIGGIGFLGAGAILQSGGSVQGLTTAAGIWVAGGIGLACGAGYYVIAVEVTLLCALILIVVGWLEKRFKIASKKKD